MSTQLEQSSADIALQIMDVAGGAGYGRGRPFIDGVAGAVAHYYERFNDGVGHACRDDAAASAAASMWGEWQIRGASVIALEKHGMRAASRSLRGDMTHGATGPGRQAYAGVHCCDPEAARLSMENASFARWTGEAEESGADRFVLHEGAREVIGWISSVLEPKASGIHGKSERARLTFLVQLIRGRDITEAAHDAGYAHARSALESLCDGKVWDRLRKAMARHPLKPGAALEVKGLFCGWLRTA